MSLLSRPIWSVHRPAFGRRFRPAVEILESRLAPATLTVNSLADNTAADAFLSLREAILVVNAGTDAGVIPGLGRALTAGEIGQIDPTQPFGTADTIQFSGSGTELLGGSLPTLTKSVSITGPGASNLGVDGNGQQFRPFTIASGAAVTMAGLTIANGGAAVQGGGIHNAGTLVLQNSIVSGNKANGGGGIYNSGTLLVQNSTIAGNSATYNGNGGGIYNGNGMVLVQNSSLTGNYARHGGGVEMGGVSATVTVQNSTLAGNMALAGGGGIENIVGTLTVQNSTLSGNVCPGGGGGISNSGTLTVQNSTLAGNSTNAFGGAILNFSGTVALENSTLAGNAAGWAGGAIRNGNMLTLISTLIAGNVAPTAADIDGAVNVASSFNNLIGDGSTSNVINGMNGNLVGTAAFPIDPRLGPLQDNGGPTQTMALLPGSLAIDAGSNPLGLATDQRGGPFVRTFGNGTDIGAFETQPYATAATLVSSVNPLLLGRAVTFSATVTAPTGGVNVPTGTVSFFDGGTLLGTAAVVNGVAAFTTTTLTSGTHAIIAVYNPTAEFISSTSPAVSEIVSVPPPPTVPPPSVSVAFTRDGQEVLEVVTSDGTLIQFDATGAHTLATGVRTASAAFGPQGEVMVVVFQDGRLFQFDTGGTHLLAAGILSASVAFTVPGGEVLEVVSLDGTLTQYDATGAHMLTSGVRTASVAFGSLGEVMAVAFQDGRLVEYDAAGSHLLASGIVSAGVALSPPVSDVLTDRSQAQEVLDTFAADGTLTQFDARGSHKLGEF